MLNAGVDIQGSIDEQQQRIQSPKTSCSKCSLLVKVFLSAAQNGVGHWNSWSKILLVSLCRTAVDPVILLLQDWDLKIRSIAQGIGWLDGALFDPLAGTMSLGLPQGLFVDRFRCFS